MASFSRGGAEPWRPTGVVRSPSLVQRDDSLVVGADEVELNTETSTRIYIPPWVNIQLNHTGVIQ
jgi:hypothetical protein